MATAMGDWYENSPLGMPRPHSSCRGNPVSAVGRGTAEGGLQTRHYEEVADLPDSIRYLRWGGEVGTLYAHDAT